MSDGLLREYISNILLLEKQPSRRKTRTLYHINRHPARPQPKMKYAEDVIEVEGEWRDFKVPGSNVWDRPWLQSSVKSGVFLTNNPVGIRMNHGVAGNVYAYRVPEWVIKKSGGLQRFSAGSEILIPEDVWNEAGSEIEFLGKSMSRSELDKKTQKMAPQFAAAPGTESSPSGWMRDDPGMRKVISGTRYHKIVDGLRSTKHLAAAVKMMTPKEVQRAIDAFEYVHTSYEPRRGDDEILQKLRQAR